MSKPAIMKGLEGVYVAESGISLIDAEGGKLYYAGYDVEELVDKSCYEEVTYLLLNQRLPNKREYAEHIEKMKMYRRLSKEQVESIGFLASRSDAVGALASFFLLSQGMASSLSSYEQALHIVSQAAPAVAAICRSMMGKEYIEPREDLSHAANFLYMLTGKTPDQFESKAIDAVFILHAEHGIPASTFGALVTASTLSDLYSSVAAGTLSLKGPLHGGASEAAHRQLNEIGDAGRVEGWVMSAISGGKRVMGFGHRVYRIYDPRARIIKQMAGKAAERYGGDVKRMYEIAVKLEEEAIKHLSQRGIFPNVDFWTPILYTALGIPIECYTALFAASRTVGWAAHILEYWNDNRLIRPLHFYTGERDKRYVSVDERG